VTVLRIPGELGLVPPVDPDGKPFGTDRALKSNERGRPDVIDITSGGKRLSAGIRPMSTGAAGENGGVVSGAREMVRQRLASGFYERAEVLEAIAGRLLDRLGI
jgi:hypothetical protein